MKNLDLPDQKERDCLKKLEIKFGVVYDFPLLSSKEKIDRIRGHVQNIINLYQDNASLVTGQDYDRALGIMSLIKDYENGLQNPRT
jgi:hypothetical protein